MSPAAKRVAGTRGGKAGSSQLDRIHAATIDLVAKRGYHGTTVQRIAKNARVGEATFYEKYSSKEDCFLALFRQAVADARSRVLDAAASSSGYEEQVEAGLDAFLGFVREDPARARLCLIESQAAGEVAREIYVGAIEEAAAALRISENVGTETSTLASREVGVLRGVLWVVRQRLVRGELDHLDELRPELVRLLLGEPPRG